MGFTKVYRSLLEIFPQVDSRVLRAVAIDHHKDVSAAVEAVISEVIPFLESVKSNSPGSVSIRGSSVEEATPVLSAAPSALPVDTYAVGEPSEGTAHKPRSCNELGLESALKVGDELPPDLNDDHKKLVSAENGINGVSNDISGDHVTNESIQADEHLGMSNLKFPIRSLEASGHDSTFKEKISSSDEIHSNSAPESVICNEEIIQIIVEDVIGSGDDFERSILSSMQPIEPEKSPLNQQVYDYILEEMVSSSDEFHANYAPESVVCNEENIQIIMEDVVGSVLDSERSILSIESDESPLNQQVYDVESSSTTLGSRHESTLSNSISKSCQKHITEVVEELIQNVKDNKKALFEGMQALRSLMKEVEIKEQTAERARMEAEMAAQGTLAKVEELRKMVQQAEEEKCLYAGDVYGEKAIQDTELKALRNRVLILSDERDKSLTFLHEVRQTLEMRLAAAEKEIIAVEQEKEEKERAAMEACAEQELALEKVLDEIATLKLLAKESAKVHEFLLDRGCAVDALQGEIAVAYQDVKRLKEKLEENVPLAKLLASSQFFSKSGGGSSSSSSLSSSAMTPALDVAAETVKEDEWELCEAPLISCYPPEV